MINYQPIEIAKISGPNINIVNRGGANVGVDIESPRQIKIQKVLPKNTKYDLIWQKELFKNEVEMFK